MLRIYAALQYILCQIASFLVFSSVRCQRLTKPLRRIGNRVQYPPYVAVLVTPGIGSMTTSSRFANRWHRSNGASVRSLGVFLPDGTRKTERSGHGSQTLHHRTAISRTRSLTIGRILRFQQGCNEFFQQFQVRCIFRISYTAAARR